MVRRRISSVPGGAVAVLALLFSASCAHERDMPETVDMEDSMSILRVLESQPAADSMLDTLPGGEMARGDSLATGRLLRDKMDE